MKRTPISLYPLPLALFAFALPSASQAASFVKSVEYAEMTMAAGATTVSGNLTKGASPGQLRPVRERVHLIGNPAMKIR